MVVRISRLSPEQNSSMYWAQLSTDPYRFIREWKQPQFQNYCVLLLVVCLKHYVTATDHRLSDIVIRNLWK
jgi:hypothetical protein